MPFSVFYHFAKTFVSGMCMMQEWKLWRSVFWKGGGSNAAFAQTPSNSCLYFKTLWLWGLWLRHSLIWALSEKKMLNLSLSCHKYLWARVWIISKHLGASIVIQKAEICRKPSGNLSKLCYCWWVSKCYLRQRQVNRKMNQNSASLIIARHKRNKSS